MVWMPIVVYQMEVHICATWQILLKRLDCVVPRLSFFGYTLLE